MLPATVSAYLRPDRRRMGLLERVREPIVTEVAPAIVTVTAVSMTTSSLARGMSPVLQQLGENQAPEVHIHLAVALATVIEQSTEPQPGSQTQLSSTHTPRTEQRRVQ